MTEDIFWDRNNGYGVMINEYNGNFSLVAGKNNDKGLFKEWVYLSKWDQETRGWTPDEKKRPMGIYLGNKESAIKALEFFLGELKGERQEPTGTNPGDPAPDGSEENVPF